jgi:hypothetical protein
MDRTEEKRARYRAALEEELRAARLAGKPGRVEDIEREIAAVSGTEPKRVGFDRDAERVAQPKAPREPRRGRSRGRS